MRAAWKYLCCCTLILLIGGGQDRTHLFLDRFSVQYNWVSNGIRTACTHVLPVPVFWMSPPNIASVTKRKLHTAVQRQGPMRDRFVIMFACFQLKIVWLQPGHTRDSWAERVVPGDLALRYHGKSDPQKGSNRCLPLGPRRLIRPHIQPDCQPYRTRQLSITSCLVFLLAAYSDANVEHTWQTRSSYYVGLCVAFFAEHRCLSGRFLN